MRLHEKIVKLRKEKNVSQERLADELGVSRQAVAKWEGSEALPEIEKLIRLSKYFGVTIDSLVNDDEKCGEPMAPRDVETERVVRFLCKAKKSTYAAKKKEESPSRTNSHDLRYEEDGFEYFDTYLGGERFSGEEAVWLSDSPIWAMNYTGRVLGELFSGDFLKEALANVSMDMPFRGPRVYVNNEYCYHCFVNGSFDWFDGYEEIVVRDQKVYECKFHGGTVK
ncbi:MAG: transcriptional regulator [Spirochaetae bacterium HGW-Spirochaetae-3]|jgi:transcriptional regulator with XRE-family HTH domain|nr:MAG: transcriptional regulator [Spirochaetae bacterium HGW-Spirochaetae-3]